MKQAKLSSFGFKNGAAPEGAAVFDCRSLRNPHYVVGLRPLDGRHAAVQEFVRADPAYRAFFDAAFSAALNGEAIAFGCFGGKHRSVALAEIVAGELKKVGYEVEVRHANLA